MHALTKARAAVSCSPCHSGCSKRTCTQHKAGWPVEGRAKAGGGWREARGRLALLEAAALSCSPALSSGDGGARWRASWPEPVGAAAFHMGAYVGSARELDELHLVHLLALALYREIYGDTAAAAAR